MKVETDIIASIYCSESSRRSNDICDHVETFKTDIIDFIGDVIMCLMLQLL